MSEESHKKNNTGPFNPEPTSFIKLMKLLQKLMKLLPNHGFDISFTMN